MSNPVTNNRIQDLKSNVRYRAFEFSKKILGFVQAFPNTKIYWVFQDQLLRSATSIGANLYEAKSASSKKDFMRYYDCLLYTSPSPRDRTRSRMPSSA